MRQDNIRLLEETLQICRRGSYPVHGREQKLPFTPEELQKVQVFLPEDLEDLQPRADLPPLANPGGCVYSCRNLDSFSMARKLISEYSIRRDPRNQTPILVLNFANAFRPGGGVRNGAKAQEEDLCRKSSLLVSLESEAAAPFYAYHRRLCSDFASNAIVISPNVAIIRDEHGELLEEPVPVSVMTCAAPNLRDGLQGMRQDEYEKLFYDRIQAMLRCAAYMGARYLVLGAFGCGAFRNDAGLVSDLFARALKEFESNGMKEKDLFARVDFAVLSRNPSSYNYREFYRNFGGNPCHARETPILWQKEQQEIEKREENLDPIMGSLVGGAVGDALGYPVEFWDRSQILQTYGSRGITDYALDPGTGKALISDDTQMTLFTANGILAGETRLCVRGFGGPTTCNVAFSYQDWLSTQMMPYSQGRLIQRYKENEGFSWLLDVPELYSRRAPGTTCLTALQEQRRKGGDPTGRADNYSKGCGGIMRVAPLGLWGRNVDLDELDRQGAELAAMTHGHSLGYMPAAVLTHILNRIVYPKDQKLSLREIIEESKEAVSRIFPGDCNLPRLLQIMDLAAALSGNQEPDHVNIRKIGEGWVAEETLAIALYCALRYEHDFSAGVIAAVNITGDSDSTGAVTGNILGAINGYSGIQARWKQNLELLPVLQEMARDLCHGCMMSEFSTYEDPDWTRKYIEMHWKEEAGHKI